jgi:hypothetical protein
MKHYRKIWEEANHEKIPKGYHIHHIDGDRDNNDPSNLLCVSPEEHWEIHYTQGDIRCLSGKFVQGASEAGKKGGAVSGYKWTEDQKTPLSDIQKASYVRRGGSPLKNRPISDEHKHNIGLGCTGDKNGMYGKNHTEDTKSLISKNRIGKGRAPGYHCTDEQIEIIKLSRKKFYDGGGKSPASKLYTGISTNGEILFSKLHIREALVVLKFTERQFKTLGVYCRRNPGNYHPIFDMILIDEGKLYA